MSRKPLDEPIHAAAEHGEVVLEGPDGLAASFTPAAALLSAEHLTAAARQAQRDPQAEGR